ncbi:MULTISPECIES: hypothetical protein [Streptomyces]|uniref:Uncharacterized protein n=1 Tax=Streptomyces muensis TaxID=1077944 RepID=A0A9X1PTX3_STRM4|nr:MULTISPECIES: hypothetical protein [Streptomyces]MCF1592474.1 hypothetical protein [Streptomyces muensis]QKV98331.1 hypothetical protein HUT19_42200 [Streptomyces sp. NA02950]
MSNDRLAQQLAATAHPNTREEAAVWLLAESGHWLEELDRMGLISRDTDSGQARVDWPGTSSQRYQLIGTDAEFQILTIARALAAPELGADFPHLSKLDADNRLLVLHAIAWASAGREWAKSLRLLPGMRCGVCDRRLKGLEGADFVDHMRLHGRDV